MSISLTDLGAGQSLVPACWSKVQRPCILLHASHAGWEEENLGVMLRVFHMQMRHRTANHRLPGLLARVGKRLLVTRHLAIHINYDNWQNKRVVGAPIQGWFIGTLIGSLLSSDYEPSADMKTLDLSFVDTFGGDSAPTMDYLHDWISSRCCRLRSVSLCLKKTPLWHSSGQLLLHICFHYPVLQEFGGSLELRASDLPKLETLYLRGGPSLVSLDTVDFSASSSFKILHTQECFIQTLSLPPGCKVHLLAQTSNFIVKLDDSKEDPLVKLTEHVCLPTDLSARVTEFGYYSNGDEEEERMLEKTATGIVDIFPSMRTLVLTRPHSDFRHYENLLARNRCFSYVPDEEERPRNKPNFSLTCMPISWQHANLRELFIEGKSLSVNIPKLPSLQTLVIPCRACVALTFAKPKVIGQTISRMIITGERIDVHMQQYVKLCGVLKDRNLVLDGDWNVVVSLHASNVPAPSAAELQYS